MRGIIKQYEDIKLKNCVGLQVMDKEDFIHKVVIDEKHCHNADDYVSKSGMTFHTTINLRTKEKARGLWKVHYIIAQFTNTKKIYREFDDCREDFDPLRDRVENGNLLYVDNYGWKLMNARKIKTLQFDNALYQGHLMLVPILPNDWDFSNEQLCEQVRIYNHTIQCQYKQELECPTGMAYIIYVPRTTTVRSEDHEDLEIEQGKWLVLHRRPNSNID